MNNDVMCKHCKVPVAEIVAPSERPVNQDWIAVGEVRCQGRDNCALSLEPNSSQCIAMVAGSNS